jgi:hypothetical protein
VGLTNFTEQLGVRAGSTMADRLPLMHTMIKSALRKSNKKIERLSTEILSLGRKEAVLDLCAIRCLATHIAFEEIVYCGIHSVAKQGFFRSFPRNSDGTGFPRT